MARKGKSAKTKVQATRLGAGTTRSRAKAKPKAEPKPRAKPKAKRPSRKAPARNGSGLRKLERRLAEAAEQQKATGEILRVISQSPTDVQQVFETIAANALRLCNSTLSTCTRFDGGLIHIAAFHHFRPEGVAAFRAVYPCPPSRSGATQRAILTGEVVHMANVLEDAEYEYREAAEVANYRSVLAVPMLRDGRPIGAVTVFRDAAQRFSDGQVKLLKVFADQAAIAIENARLFNETKEALEQQTATSEILRVISQSPRDVQPVFEAIARAALKLCGASLANVFRFDGELVYLVVVENVNVDPEYSAGIHAVFPRPPGRDTGAGRAILARRIIAIPDVMEDPEYAIGRQTLSGGFRSVLGAPLMRGQEAIGAITVCRPQPGQFPESLVALLQTFADQAVIAIENVRLFTELDKRNRDLT